MRVNQSQEDSLSEGYFFSQFDDLMSLMDELDQGIILISNQGEIKKINNTAVKIFALGTKQIVDQPIINTHWTWVNAEGQELVEKTHPALVTLRTGEKTSDIILGIHHKKSGLETWVRFSAIPKYISDDNKPDFIYLFLSDITSQKQADLDLTETMKDLFLQNKISELATGEDLILEDFLSQAVKILQTAWQRTDLSFCRIVVYEKTYETGDYSTSRWSQSSDISVNNRKIGSIEVGYTTESAEVVGESNNEEELMLRTIADQLGRIILQYQISGDLAEKTKVLELAVQAANLGTWYQNFSDDVMVLDETACKHYGFDRKTIKEKEIIERIHPDDLNSFLEIYGNVLEKGISCPERVEHRVIHPDGSIVWLSVNAKINFKKVDGKFQPIYSVGTSMDITSWKENEEALRNSEEWFSKFFHKSPVSAAIVRLSDSKLIDVNDAWTDLTGYDRETAVGKTPIELGLWKSYDEHSEFLERHQKNDQIKNSQYKIITRSGIECILLFSAMKVVLNGESCLLTQAIDITSPMEAEKALRESAQKFKALFESGGSVRLVVDVESGKIVDANKTAVEFYGYSYDDLLAMDIANIHNSSIDEIRKDLANAYREKQRHFMYSSRLADGQSRQVDVYAHPVITEAKKLVFVDVYDRTDREIAEIEREQIYQDLSIINSINEELNQGASIKKIASLLAKEIRKYFPVTGVTLYLMSDDQQFLTNSSISLPGDLEENITKLLKRPIPQIQIAISPESTYGKALLSKKASIDTDPEGVINRIYEIIQSDKDSSLSKKFLTNLIPLITNFLKYKSIISIPLVIEKKIIGLFEISSRESIDQKTLERLESIAKQLATAIARRKAEEDLETSNERFEELVANIPEVFWISDHATKEMIYTSPADEDIFGKNLKLIHPPGEQQSTFDFIFPEDLGTFKKFLRDTSQGIPTDMEFRIVRPNNDIRWIHERSFPIMDKFGQHVRTAGITTDITHRKMQDNALALSERRNESIVNAIPDIVIRLKSNGSIVDYHSPLAHPVFSSQDIIGKNIKTLFEPEIADQILSRIQKAFTKEKLQSIEYSLGKDDQTVFFEGRIIADKNADEAVIIIRNITNRVQMEEEIRKSSEKYRQLSEELEERVKERTAQVQDLYNNAPTGYHALDPEGIFIMINDTSLSWLGYTREEVIGKKRFSDILTPESVKLFEYLYPKFMKEGSVKNIEFEYVRKDGSILPVILSASAVYDEKGNYLRSRATVFDHTEMKAIEEEVQRVNQLSDSALELARAGYWYMVLNGEDSDKYYGSERALKILGEDFESGSSWCLLSDWFNHAQEGDPRLAEHANQSLMDIINGKSSHYEVTYAYKRPIDGKVVWIHDIADIINDPKNKSWILSGVVQDITQQQELENELKKAKDAADSANRAKSNFLANMSHEIRTPMNAILGFTQILLKDQSLDTQQRDQLEIINRSGDHLLALINDILEMSKIEAGKSTFNPSIFNFHMLLSDIKSMFHPAIEEKGIFIELIIGSNVPKTIITDENKLREILINIIGNAVKFTDQGGITIRCWSEKNQLSQNPNSLWLFIDIKDTGIGIESENLPRLFDPFIQAESDGQFNKGTGLGLPISQNHAKLLGGEITVTSEHGMGSTFRIKLHVQKSMVLDEKDAVSEKEIIGLLPGTQPIKILIVDDHEDNLLVVEKILEQIGLFVRTADNGQLAIEITQSWHPDLILMDLRMPVMDGREATRIIKATKAGKDISIVAMTASTFDVDPDEMHDFGFAGILSKPFKISEVYSLLESIFKDKFQYREQSEIKKRIPSKRKKVQLTHQDLDVLPQDLIDKMKEATISAEIEILLELIDQAHSIDPKIANGLRSLAENFEYDQLINLFSERMQHGH